MSATDLSIDKIKSLISHINGIIFLIEKLDRQRRRKKYETLWEIFSRWITTYRAKYVLGLRMKDLEKAVRGVSNEQWGDNYGLLLQAFSVACKAEYFAFGMLCLDTVLEITLDRAQEYYEVRLIAYTGKIECGMEILVRNISTYSVIENDTFKHLSFLNDFVLESLDSVCPEVRENLRQRLVRARNLMYFFEMKREALVLKMPRTVEQSPW